MEEIWRDIKGYEGSYQVSNLGNVKSFKRNKEIVLKNSLTNKGYVKVFLSKNSKSKGVKIHRLVLQAFIHNLENKPYVNHKNGVKNDNRLENLEWCTAQENSIHGRKIGLYNYQIIKARKPVIMLSLDNIELGRFNSMLNASKIMNIGSNCISRCCSGKRKTTGGYKWEYDKGATEWNRKRYNALQNINKEETK